MRFVESNNDNGKPGTEQQKLRRVEVMEGPGVIHIVVPGAKVVIELCDREITSNTPSCPSKPSNDNSREKALRRSQAFGRIIATRVRKLQREAGLSQREAVKVYAEAKGFSASEFMSLLHLHHRRREARIKTMRRSALVRYRAAGFSNNQIAVRLNVTPQHVGRLVREYKLS